MSAPHLLELDRATLVRGTFTLGPVSARLDAGRVLAILGPNGAGKSSVLALASGRLAPTQGRVTLSGADAARLPRGDVARRVALLGSGGLPAFELRVLDLVLHGRFAHGRGWRLPEERDVASARECLARVGCDALASRDVRTLSSGELQRVHLATALAQEAPVLLLDEPTASLDVVQRAGIRSLVRLGRTSGLAQVIVTHDLDLASEACDEAILLREGRVIAAGPVDEVLVEERLRWAFGLGIRVRKLPDGGLHVDIEPS